LTPGRARFRILGRPDSDNDTSFRNRRAGLRAGTGLAAWRETQGATLADYAVTTWTEKEGLPAGRVRAIAQGFDGYLWLGLETGLVRFDGVRFVPWAGAPLPSGTVWSLLAARDHSLFVG
jgi:hypothetical protein